MELNKNVDNDLLMPLANEKFVIGYVDEVNGEGGKEIPGFIPTKNEIFQIVKYWMKTKIQNDWWYFNTGQTGSSDYRMDAFAISRISRIYDLIDQKDVDRIIEEAVAECRQEYGQNMKLWQAFRSHDSALWQLVQEEYQRCSGSERDGREWVFAAGLSVSSRGLKKHTMIPKKYSYEGKNISPPISWERISEKTRSLAITMCDLDSSHAGFTHWIIFNIPKKYHTLREGIPTKEMLPNGALQGRNDYRMIGYTGPQMTDPLRRYQFSVYALDQFLQLPPGISRDQLLDAMEGHVIDEGNLTVLYG